jgi:hypothetical protein
MPESPRPVGLTGNPGEARDESALTELPDDLPKLRAATLACGPDSAP